MTGMRAVWISGLAALLLLIGLGVWLRPLEPGVVALQLSFTPQAFAQVVHAWPPEHLARFRAHLPVDGLLLLAYGFFCHGLATRSRVFRPLGARGRALATWAGPAAALCDAAENLMHAWLTAAPRFGQAPWYALSGGVALAKWLLLLAFALLLAGALVAGRND